MTHDTPPPTLEYTCEYARLRLPGAAFAGTALCLNITPLKNILACINVGNKQLALHLPRQATPAAENFLLPIPLNCPETLGLTVTFMPSNPRQAPKHFVLTVDVNQKHFELEHLDVEEDFCNFDPATAEIIDQEERKLNLLLARVSPKLPLSLPLLRPTPGEISGEFGQTRVFNGKQHSTHMGIDISADDGEKVLAVEDGTVIFSGQLYLGGSTIILDHGLGVFSLYMHLSKQLVRQGQTLLRGQVIGEVGCSGRVTGSHLHLGLSILGEYVDPFSLIS